MVRAIAAAPARLVPITLAAASLAATPPLAAAFLPEGAFVLLVGSMTAGLLWLIRPSSLLWPILALVVAVSGVAPVLGAAIMLLGCVTLVARQSGAFHPTVLLGAALSGYILIGAPNISSYRGEVLPETTTVLLLAVVGIVAGCQLAAGSSRRTPSRKLISGSAQVVALSFLPGLLGVAILFAQAGLVLADPARRFSASPLALVLVETLTASLALLCLHVYGDGLPPRRGQVFAIFATVALLASSGYRGFAIVAVAIVFFSRHFYGRHAIKPISLILVAFLAIGTMAGFDQIRRATSGGALIATETATVRYGAESLPNGFRQVHFALRESIAVTQRFITAERVSADEPSLFWSDILTLMPGSQQSGGALVGEVVGRSQGGGITPGAVGAVVYEFGRASPLFFIGLGAVTGLAWRRVEDSTTGPLVYFFAVVYTLHYMHRGIPKISYVLVPLAFVLFSRLWRARTDSRIRVQSQSATPSSSSNR